jgi:hypothetical protein
MRRNPADPLARRPPEHSEWALGKKVGTPDIADLPLREVNQSALAELAAVGQAQPPLLRAPSFGAPLASPLPAEHDVLPSPRIVSSQSQLHLQALLSARGILA